MHALYILPGTETVLSSMKYKDELLSNFTTPATITRLFINDLNALTSLDKVLTFRISWVEVNGTTYKKGAVIVLGMDLVPDFGMIDDIIVFNTDEIFFVCTAVLTISFDHHFNSYLVSPSNDFCIVHQIHLHDHTPLSIYRLSNSFYVPLKYQLPDFS